MRDIINLEDDWKYVPDLDEWKSKVKDLKTGKEQIRSNRKIVICSETLAETLQRENREGS